MSEGDYEKPLPSLEGLSGEFYGWCAKGELRFQRCAGCEAWRHVPRPMCPACGSMEWSWQSSSGRGRVFSWTTTAMPLHPGFKSSVPYASVIVELEEGVRIVTEIVDCAPTELVIDQPVTVAFCRVTPAITLPKFCRV
jgi:uncharacterized OB-fold protein